MEVIDILNSEYKVYDRKSYPLEINLYSKTDHKSSSNALIKIESIPNNLSKNNEVFQLLIGYLKLHKIPFNKIKNTNLDYLLLRVIME